MRKSAIKPRGQRPIQVISTATRPPSLRQALAIRMEKLLWRGRAESWDEVGSSHLDTVVEAVLDACRPGPDVVALDLGCGSGQVTLPLARGCAHVIAVDLSEKAVELLKRRYAASAITNIHALTQPIETLDLGPESVDLVVSNYALHHLRDHDKAELIRHIFGWLRPGGWLVVGDIMIGRGTSADDRAVIRGKVRSLAGRGMGGWWRILKNAWRYAFRFQEKPLPAGHWKSIAQVVGFEHVRARRVVAEAWLLTARKPGATSQPRSRMPSSSRSASVGQVSTAL